MPAPSRHLNPWTKDKRVLGVRILQKSNLLMNKVITVV